MPKDDWIHIRIDSDLKNRVQDYAKQNNYDDMATYIREVLLEKKDPRPAIDKITLIAAMNIRHRKQLTFALHIASIIVLKLSQ
jgi:hypothetical protein